MLLRRSCSIAALGMSSMLISAQAFCQSEDVEQHYQRGLELRRTNQDRAALEEFRMVFRAEHSVRAQAQIAFAEQELGLWSNAAADIEAVHDAHGDAWADRHQAVINESFEAIESHFVVLEVIDAVPGAEIHVDGSFVGTVGSASPVRIEGGQRHIEVRAEGYALTQRVIEVLPGATQRVSVPMIRIPRRPLPRDLRLLGWSTAIGAGLLVVGGAVALVFERNDGNAFNASTCAVMSETALTSTCSSLESITHTSGILSVVGFVGGALLGITSTVLFTRPTQATPRTPIALACGAGPGRYGAMCGLAF